MNIPERMSRFNVPGVSITHFADGKIAYSKHFGTLEAGTDKAVNENSIFHACSISKMVTSLCVLRLAQDGVLDLHRDVNEYLTSWKITDSELTSQNKVTLANLLAHQGGFYDCEDSFNPHKQGDDIPHPIDILRKARIGYAPETEFEYSDTGFCVIAQVLEDVLGEAVPQIAKRLVFDPLGLTRTFFWEIGKNPPDGVSLADCAVGHGNNGEIVDEIRAQYPNIEGAALWTTTNELARIVIDIINAYHGKDGTILSQEMAKFMLSPYGCAEYAGLGVFLVKDKAGAPCFFSQGWGVGMQCKLRAHYEGQSGVVVMTNSEPGMEQDAALVGEIIEHVCNG
ncbi:MAG: beta-lactamase family protein [Defluviitaleaceae bacterium]|nr:beta-lactamase family protein [Defluviitaleaceae bacterium]